MAWTDRTEAGQKLAERLFKYHNKPKTIILGLPRGGVVVAAEVAKRLHLPLDVIITRKIGAPGDPELAIGAIDEYGHAFLNENFIALTGISEDYLVQTIEQEKDEAMRRLREYRALRPPLDLSSMTAILVDDGVATGYTMRAAVASCRYKGASSIVVAVPVVAPDVVTELSATVDEMVYLQAPVDFMSVGRWYRDFAATSDEQVIKLLAD